MVLMKLLVSDTKQMSRRGTELTNSVSSGPAHKVDGDNNGFLGLPRYVSRKHTHGQSLCGPETEDDVVGHQQACLGGSVLVDDCHEDDGSNKRRDHINSHGDQILASLPADPCRAEKNDNDKDA